MILFSVLTLVFLALLLFPFLLARASLDSGKPRALAVKDDNVRDPRYFAKAFVALMERALSDYDGGGVIRLSKPETLLEPPLPTQSVIDAVVFSSASFAPTNAHAFEKEIYCRADGRLPAETTLRAIACRGTLWLSENCAVARWADSEGSFTAKAGCRLGVSASSETLLQLSPGCTFRRLYAPQIRIGEPALPAKDPPPQLPSEKLHRDTGDIEDFAELDGDVIAMDNLTVGECATVNGSLKTRRHMRVKSGARILGNVIANGNVVLEKDVFVGGIVFSQGWVFIGPDCQIGRMGRIKSVVARDGVVLAEGARVFGYVGGEQDGRTVSADEYADVIGDQY